MEILVAGMIFLLISSAAATWLAGRRHLGRWGSVTISRESTGPGAYRQAALSHARPRGVPASISWAAWTSFVWAGVTGLVLAPSGVIFAAALAEARLPGSCWL